MDEAEGQAPVVGKIAAPAPVVGIQDEDAKSPAIVDATTLPPDPLATSPVHRHGPPFAGPVARPVAGAETEGAPGRRGERSSESDRGRAGI
jgi:hypothetical protein